MQILASPDHSVFHLKVLPMKLLHFGIELQRCFSDPRSTVQVLTSGPLDAFSSNLPTANLFSTVKVKLDKSLKFSSVLEPQMNNCGKVRWNYRKWRQLSQNGKWMETKTWSNFALTSKASQKQRTSWPKWCSWNHPSVSP